MQCRLIVARDGSALRELRASSPMRIVRFHLESWQKDGSVASTLTTNPSPVLGNVVILSPFLRHRQRSPDPSDKYVKRFYTSPLATTSHGQTSTPKEKSIRRTRSREYPELVRLTYFLDNYFPSSFILSLSLLISSLFLSATNIHTCPGRGQPADATGPRREWCRRHDPIG